MQNRTLTDLIDRIQTAQRIAVVMHVSPDGDACGSAFALRLALLARGKAVVIVCDHRVPWIYADLPGADAVAVPAVAKGEAFDLAIAVDVADRQRMGESVAVFDAAAHTVQIDHHGTNPAYAEVNYLRSPLSATGVLIAEVIDALGVPFDAAIGKCLYVAVATDTGNFKQQNTDACAMELAARCIQTGVDPSEVTRRVFDVRPLEQLKLIARALESLTPYAEGKLVMMALTKADFRETGALPEHTEGIVNFGINTKDACMACLLSQAGDAVKASLRSLPPYDVARVAASLGGGGHKLAAGCTLQVPMDQAWDRMREALQEEVDRAR